MGLILGVLLVVAFCVFPVMITAKKLGAGKTEFFDCILAVIAVTFLTSIVVPFLPGANSSDLMAYIYSFLIAGLVYKFMLQATYITSVLIAIISTAITFIALYIVAAIFT